MRFTQRCLTLLLLATACLTTRANSGFYTNFVEHEWLYDIPWQGDIDNFDIKNGWLHSDIVSEEGSAAIVAQSYIMIDATWSFYYRHTQPLGQNNFIRYFLAADRANLHNAQGYYIEIGRNNGSVTLMFYDGNTAEELCSAGNIAFGDEGTLFIEVSRDTEGLWLLSVGSRRSTLTLKGSAMHNTWHNCQYTGIYVFGRDLAQRQNHYFDELEVGGEEEMPEGEDNSEPDDDPSDDPAMPDMHDDAVEAQQGTLLINEIMFHPAQGAQEYVEVINLTGEVLDLSGVTITTRTAKGKFNTGNKFPDGSFVMPSEVATLCADATALARQFAIDDTTNIYSTRWRQQLNNTSQTLFLLNSDKSVCYDSVYYHKDYHHSLISDDSGVSLERVSTSLNSMNREAWHSAAGPTYGTPGAANSQRIDTEAEYDQILYLQPEAFSPNGDGTDDICVIHYNMPREGYSATLRLFTPTGVLITTIAENTLLARQGIITWDGTTPRGTAQIGIYALVMQATHPNSKAIKKKIPLVVIGR